MVLVHRTRRNRPCALPNAVQAAAVAQRGSDTRKKLVPSGWNWTVRAMMAKMASKDSQTRAVPAVRDQMGRAGSTIGTSFLPARCIYDFSFNNSCKISFRLWHHNN